MNHDRIFAFLIGCFIWAISAFGYLHLRALGFPDGFLTEFDRAQKILLNGLVWISIPVGFWFIFLGTISFQQPITRKLRLTLLLYAMFVLLLVSINFYLRQHLDHGGGG
jgi:hypothetical protein